MRKINIKILDPNNNKQLEEALSDMIAYELVNREIHTMSENDLEEMAVSL